MLRDIKDQKITLIDIDEVMCREWADVIAKYRYAYERIYNEV